MRKQIHKYENPTGLSTSQLWLLATSAMLTQLNGERHDTLLPYHDQGTDAKLESCKQCLLRDWEIESLADLSDTLMYLHKHKTFEPVQHNWELLSTEEFEAVQQFGPEASAFHTPLNMVQHYQYNLPGSDNAWHYGRCSWVIRQSFYCGYISEEEAWGLLEENGQRIRESFNSWEEFGLSYVVGAQYWRRDNYTEASVQRYKDQLTFLMTNQQSPWVRLDWAS